MDNLHSAMLLFSPLRKTMTPPASFSFPNIPHAAHGAVLRSQRLNEHSYLSLLPADITTLIEKHLFDPWALCVCGGSISGNGGFSRAELLSRATEKAEFRSVTGLPQPVYKFACMQQGDSVIIAGGMDQHPYADAFALSARSLCASQRNPFASEPWQRLPSLPVATLSCRGVTLPSGEAVVVGGQGPSIQVLPAARTSWSMSASVIATVLIEHAAVALGDRVFACGGQLTADEVSVYDAHADHWSRHATRLAQRRWQHAACAHAGAMWVAGGVGTSSSSFERIDPREDTARQVGRLLPPLAVARVGLELIALPQSDYLVALGGFLFFHPSLQASGGGDLFDLRNLQHHSDWLPSMPIGRLDFGALALSL